MTHTPAAGDGHNAAFAEFALAAARDAGSAILPHFRAPIHVDDKGGARGYDRMVRACAARRSPTFADGLSGFERLSATGRR